MYRSFFELAMAVGGTIICSVEGILTLIGFLYVFGFFGDEWTTLRFFLAFILVLGLLLGGFPIAICELFALFVPPIEENKKGALDKWASRMSKEPFIDLKN